MTSIFPDYPNNILTNLNLVLPTLTPCKLVYTNTVIHSELRLSNLRTSGCNGNQDSLETVG